MHFRWGRLFPRLLLCAAMGSVPFHGVLAQLPVVNSGVVVPAPAAMRAVECGRFSSANEANALVAELVNKGYGPVWQRTREDDAIQVLVGKCAYLADAIWLRNSLRKNGYPKASERTYRDLEGLGNFSEAISPDDGLLHSSNPVVPSTTAPSNTAPPIESSLIPARYLETRQPSADDISTSTTLMNTSLADGNFSQAAALGFSLAKSLPDSNPTKGALLVTASRSFVRAERKALPVADNFVKIARGEIAATPEVQLEARWLAADSWHYYFSKPLKAREAYQEILGLYGTDAAVRARAMSEIVACMLELARSEQGTFEEVRRTCQELRATVPNSFERAHALADLIEGESYFYDNKLDLATGAFGRLLEVHPTRIREAAMAHLYLAEAAQKTGDWNTAKQHYEAVITYDFSDPKENFYWQGKRWDLKKRAADSLLFKAKEQNDSQAIESASQFTASDQPTPASFYAAFPHSFYGEAN